MISVAKKVSLLQCLLLTNGVRLHAIDEQFDPPMKVGPAFANNIATNGQISIVSEHGKVSMFDITRDVWEWQDDIMANGTNNNQADFGAALDIFGHVIGVANIGEYSYTSGNEDIYSPEYHVSYKATVSLYNYEIVEDKIAVHQNAYVYMNKAFADESYGEAVQSMDVALSEKHVFLSVISRDASLGMNILTLSHHQLSGDMTKASQTNPVAMTNLIEVRGAEGGHVAASGDWMVLGNTIGDANSTSVDAGTVYVFQRFAVKFLSSENWEPHAVLTSPLDHPKGGKFGCSVAVTGGGNAAGPSKIIVGACGKHSAAFVYAYNEEWALESILVADVNAGPLSGFGYSVAFLHPFRVAVGAPKAYPSHANRGAVFVFEKETSSDDDTYHGYAAWNLTDMYVANETSSPGISNFGSHLASAYGWYSRNQMALHEESKAVRDILLISADQVAKPKPHGRVFATHSEPLTRPPVTDDSNDGNDDNEGGDDGQTSSTSASSSDRMSVTTVMGYVAVILVPTLGLAALSIYIAKFRAKMVAERQSALYGDGMSSSHGGSSHVSDIPLVTTDSLSVDTSADGNRDGAAGGTADGAENGSFVASFVAKVRSLRPHAYVSADVAFEPSSPVNKTTRSKNPMMQAAVAV